MRRIQKPAGRDVVAKHDGLTFSGGLRMVVRSWPTLVAILCGIVVIILVSALLPTRLQTLWQAAAVPILAVGLAVALRIRHERRSPDGSDPPGPVAGNDRPAAPK